MTNLYLQNSEARKENPNYQGMTVQCKKLIIITL